MEKGDLLMDIFWVSSFFLSSHPRLSPMSVLFDFNASLNNFAPVSPIQLPVDVKRMENSDLLMDVFFCVFFLLSSPPISSFVSVVFDFNASLIDFVPVSPTKLPVDVIRTEKSELLTDVFCVSSFFCLHNSGQIR